MAVVVPSLWKKFLSLWDFCFSGNKRQGSPLLLVESGTQGGDFRVEERLAVDL